eukprot:CAMPEP_0119011154 /NCGR_PEP_ID=MMETSP1176-20130426/5488_1 /TAXON_ID=265551 /ORGANISM="Synedropsis recta cf, Strain CCMP1620" /LENGTH=108 /DNA_ID=CAMNT_0006963931 /DNA_START=322 /DNA_END=648 /DNA_ORIENTATION=+
MPTFANKQGDDIFHASQAKINSGNTITTEVAVNSRSKFSYPAYSLFAKFNGKGMSPMEDISLYGFDTNDLEDKNGNDDSAPTSLTKLQQSHNCRIADNAKYNPWDDAN